MRILIAEDDSASRLLLKMDGIELCRKIRAYEQTHKHSDYTYIIMVTVKTATKDLVEGMEAGADDFVSKPYVPSVLAVRTKAGERLLSAKEEVKKYALALEEERDNLEKRVEEIKKLLIRSLRVAAGFKRCLSYILNFTRVKILSWLRWALPFVNW